jgi:AraC-like DNA-binding protein
MKDVYINPELELENESFFAASDPAPPGGLRSAGISRSIHHNNWPDRREWRSFPYYTLNMIMENGCGSYRNETGFQCEVEYGDFFLNFPGVKHLYGPGSGEYWNEIYVNYRGKTFDIYYQQKYFCAAQPVWHLEKPEKWLRRFEKILRALRPATKMAVAAEASRFLHFLFEMLDAAEPKIKGATPHDWFEQACLLLTQDLRKIDLRAVARELGMSYPSFRFNFTRRAGKPPYQFREEKRIEAACETLVDNPSKLYKEIAFSLGYSRGDHFANQFKKHTGMLPREYQKKFGGRELR